MSTTYIYVAIGVSFLVNLIILLAFRTADRKDRTLKSLNQQVKNFRSEVSSTINRMTATTRDCEENVTSRIEHANAVQTHLAESIDLVLVHQRELDNLSSVCESYGNALNKLKIQTEQAENRLYAVQTEVRKIEAVKDFSDQFQKDVERLATQLDSLKSDYVRLVASTEQDLKNAGANQREENNEMLQIFSQTLERSKEQFSSYLAEEKKGYDDICREQEEEAEAQLLKLQNKCNEIDEKVDLSKRELNDFLVTVKDAISQAELKRDSIFKEIENTSEDLKKDRESSLSSFESKRDALFSQFDDKLSCTIDDLDNAIKSTEDSLEKRLSDKEDEITASIDLYADRLDEKEKRIEDAIKALEERKNTLIDEYKSEIASLSDKTKDSFASLEEERKKIDTSISSSFDNKRGEVEATLKTLEDKSDSIKNNFDLYVNEKEKSFNDSVCLLEEKRKEYSERCTNSLSEVAENIQNESMAMLQKLKSQAEDFLKIVNRTIGESEESYRLLMETTHGKIKDAEEYLSDIRSKISESEATLSEKMEDVTEIKEEIWNLQQTEKTLQNDIDLLRDDKTKLQDRSNEVKNQRINEEANLVRLKGEQNVIKEEKNEAAKSKKKPVIEEMDMIVGEEEEFDVSDDDL